MQQGFSLVQVSLILAVGGIILASMLPGGGNNSDNQKAGLTTQRMQAIEAATQRFMVANGRRPCPADGTIAKGASNFGIEAANPGRCTGGTPAANFTDNSTNRKGTAGDNTTSIRLDSATDVKIGALVIGTGVPSNTRVTAISGDDITINNALTAALNNTTVSFINVVAGMVPVTSLGLPPEYALDGYGRRITYIVDNRATETIGCADMQNNAMRGNILIQSTYSAGNENTIDNVMWALVSHGNDGHGAFASNGSAVNSRTNIGTSDVDTLVNAFNYDGSRATVTNYSAGPSGTFGSKIIKKNPTTGFDDIVWYSKTGKSGTRCSMGVRVDLGTTGNTPSGAQSGVILNQLDGANTGAGDSPNSTANGTDAKGTSAGNVNEGMGMASGDFNADGYKDLVTCFTNTNKCYVLLGSANGVGNGGSIINYNMKDNATSPLDGYNGFTITNNLITGGDNYCANGQSFINKNFGKTVAMGDVNGDGYDDIVIGGTYVSLIYGGPRTNTVLYTRSGNNDYATSITSSGNLNLSDLDGKGGQIFWGGSKAAAGPIALGDVNGDGIKDIVFAVVAGSNIGWSYNGPSWWYGGGSAFNPTDINNTTYIVFGVDGSRTNFPYSTNSRPTCLNIYSGSIVIDAGHADYPVIIIGNTTRYLAGPEGYNSLAVGDWNGDGYDDIVIGNYSFAYSDWNLSNGTGNVVVIFGRDSEWTRLNTTVAPHHLYDENAYVGGNGPYGFGLSNGWPKGGTKAGVNDGKTGAGATSLEIELLPVFKFNCSTGAKQCGGNKAIRITAESAKRLGASVAMGDVDGDGIKDIIATTSDALYIYKGKNVKLETYDYMPHYDANYSSYSTPCSSITCYRIPYASLNNKDVSVYGLYGFVDETSFTNPIDGNSRTTTKLLADTFDNDSNPDILLSTLNDGNSRGSSNIIKTIGRKLAAFAHEGDTTMRLESVIGIPPNAYIAGPNVPAGAYVAGINYVDKTITMSGGLAFLGDSPNEDTVYLFTKELLAIEGPANNAYAFITASGDFNLDGATDIAIGAPNYATGSPTSYGKSYILWGRKEKPWGPYCGPGCLNGYPVPLFLNSLD